MAWEIKDEWIDLAQGHHKVIFHNPDVLVPKTTHKGQEYVPVEHHLTHDFKLNACPHCGHASVKDGEQINFVTVKELMLEQLKAHHNALMRYREKHPRVRIGNGPR